MNGAIPSTSKARQAHPLHQAMTTIIRPAQFNDWRAAPTWSLLGFEARPARPADPAPVLLLGVYLEHWLTEIVRGSVRPKTYVSYRSIVRLAGRAGRRPDDSPAREGSFDRRAESVAAGSESKMNWREVARLGHLPGWPAVRWASAP